MYGRFGAMWARDVTQRSLRIRVHPFLKPRSSSSQAVLSGWRLLCVCVHYYLFAVARFSVDLTRSSSSQAVLSGKFLLCLRHCTLESCCLLSPCLFLNRL